MITVTERAELARLIHDSADAEYRLTRAIRDGTDEEWHAARAAGRENSRRLWSRIDELTDWTTRPAGEEVART